MSEYLKIEGLQVAKCLHDFLNDEVLPGSEVEPAGFWKGFAEYLHELAPRNAALLETREELQSQIDTWHDDHNSTAIDINEYRDFLAEIGYLLPQPDEFKIVTENVDPEIASMPGPQLVVPVMNARFALNAANARWGSLYDALYGTDVIPNDDGAERTASYNPTRGAIVVARGRAFLDSAYALASGSHVDAVAYCVIDGKLQIELQDGASTLADPAKFVGHVGDSAAPTSVFLRNNAIHAEICFDKDHAIGSTDGASVADIILESAITTIMDAEDSVAAVDAQDKTGVYRNWLGLMQGSLTEQFVKGGKTIERSLAVDKKMTGPDGAELTLAGRSLMLIRNVGHLMTNSAVLLADGQEAPEGLLDAMITVLIAKHDLMGNSRLQNSAAGSVYIVKPKMHGPEEVKFAVDSFARVEQLLGLEENTVKIGIMDEERRTTVNLRACIHAARERVIFINTGFLDRTGDEIHTSMHAGAVVRKDDMKNTKWIAAYEDANVDAGLKTGFQGKAQIGKGMWAKPDMMADMMREKIGHPVSGANTAWTPSPTAATLHALHYHFVDVRQRQTELAGREEASLDDILEIPLATDTNWTADEIREELENNAQGILGYVVRWVEQGIGCSKVPDFNNVGLMEDRATLRISSQHIANWLYHGVCSKEQVMDAMHKMAAKVDEQNAGDSAYINMMPDADNSIAFQAACDLVFQGTTSPSGYTEPALHARRLQFKAGLLGR